MSVDDKLRIRLDSNGVYIKPSKASPNNIALTKSVTSIRDYLILLNPQYAANLNDFNHDFRFYGNGGGGFGGVGYE